MGCAANMLAVRPQAVQIVTIATPYKYLPHLKNEKLKAFIDNLKQGGAGKSRVLSIYGLYDQTVPAEASRQKGIHTKKIYAVSHGGIIFASLTLYNIAIRRFFSRMAH